MGTLLRLSRDKDTAAPVTNALPSELLCCLCYVCISRRRFLWCGVCCFAVFVCVCVCVCVCVGVCVCVCVCVCVWVCVCV